MPCILELRALVPDNAGNEYEDKQSEIHNASNYGYLVYFFEFACAMSGYMLGVNPFDQPGVEAYKKNMFALLGKPGYEDMKNQLEKRLADM